MSSVSGMESRAPKRSGGDGTTAAMLSLLDGFRLEQRGVSFALPLSVQRLVAFLAVHRRPVQRLFVAGHLWIDSSEQHANANLRTALWRLRNLGFPLVEATRSELSLAPSVVVDLHECDAEARRVLERREPPGSGELAASLLGGDLLPDWYDDWVLIERERYRQLRLHALELLSEDLAVAGHYAAAVEAGLACVSAEPLRESAHRALVRVHLAEGNPGEAIRQYRLYRRLVHDELGLEPSDELNRLVEFLPIGDGVVTRKR
jgi:DNA-binding SARP family transcriptional activator